MKPIPQLFMVSRMGLISCFAKPVAADEMTLLQGGTTWICALNADISGLEGGVRFILSDPVTFGEAGVVADTVNGQERTFWLDGLAQDEIVFLDGDTNVEFILAREEFSGSKTFLLSGWRSKLDARETFGICEMME